MCGLTIEQTPVADPPERGRDGRHVEDDREEEPNAHEIAAGGGQTDDALAQALQRAVDEGERRLTRSWSSLLATGALGGLDVATGVLALLLVREATGSELLGALAFSIGFIALILGQSELFTEHFLLPVVARAVRRADRRIAVLRLWGGNLTTNLVAGWVAMALVVVAFPQLRATAIEVARHYPDMGIGREAFAAAVLAGMTMTLMTWMQQSTESMVARLVAAVAVAFLLAAGPMNHVIVGSLEMFGALVFGAPFGYAEMAGAAAFAGLGNAVGGIGLVTVLRLVQVGRRALEAHDEGKPGGRAGDDGQKRLA